MIKTKVHIIIVISVLFMNGLFHSSSSACTEELKMCPNGRGVSRVGPECDFAPCELPSSSEECKSKSGFWKDWCYKVYAVEVSGNPRDCSRINIDDLINRCYMELADIADSIDICDQLPKYKNNCIVHISETSTDSQLCNKLSGREKAECYKNIGRNILNADLCERASNYYYGEFDFKYICLRDIAIKRHEREFCSTLTKIGFPNDHYQHDCLNGFGAFK